MLASSDGVDPASLKPGRDLVLEMPREQGKALPHGVLLDDLLTQEDRAALDREAIERLAEWSNATGGELTFENTSLAHVWEVEFLAETFLPEVRIVRGLEIVLARLDVHELHISGLDEGRRACLKAVLAPAVLIEEHGEPDPPPRYPGILASPWRLSLRGRAVKVALRTIGAPALVRGAVYYSPYWHLAPVLQHLLSDKKLLPVLDPARLPAVPVAELIRLARGGGWVGHPNGLECYQARRRVTHAIHGLRMNPPSHPLDALLAQRALTMLEHRAAETPAFAQRLRRAFRSKRFRMALLPYDSPPEARLVVNAARSAGTPTLVVQHGFGNPEPNDPDKMLADAIAVWSEWDRENSARRLAASCT